MHASLHARTCAHACLHACMHARHTWMAHKHWVHARHAQSHARTHARTHTRMHAAMRARTHTRTHMHIGRALTNTAHPCTHPHSNAPTHPRTHAPTHECTNARIKFGTTTRTRVEPRRIMNSLARFASTRPARPGPARAPICSSACLPLDRHAVARLCALDSPHLSLHPLYLQRGTFAHTQIGIGTCMHAHSSSCACRICMRKCAHVCLLWCLCVRMHACHACIHAHAFRCTHVHVFMPFVFVCSHMHWCACTCAAGIQASEAAGPEGSIPR